MRKGIKHQQVKIIAVDNSQEMIDRAQGYISNDSSANNSETTAVELRTQDIRQTNIENASMVVLNFTLQFLAIEDRTPLLKTIFSGLNDGGCLILSEKIGFSDPLLEETLTDIHHRFKREQGYSDLEISQKREAIENVMKLETAETHIHRLKDVGFKHVTQWYQNTAFCSFIAVK